MQRKKGFRGERISSLKGKWHSGDGGGGGAGKDEDEDEGENDIDRDRCSFSVRSP